MMAIMLTREELEPELACVNARFIRSLPYIVHTELDGKEEWLTLSQKFTTPGFRTEGAFSVLESSAPGEPRRFLFIFIDENYLPDDFNTRQIALTGIRLHEMRELGLVTGPQLWSRQLPNLIRMTYSSWAKGLTSEQRKFYGTRFDDVRHVRGVCAETVHNLIVGGVQLASEIHRNRFDSFEDPNHPGLIPDKLLYDVAWVATRMLGIPEKPVLSAQVRR